MVTRLNMIILVKAMKDYTAYMLAEILKGTFKALRFSVWTRCFWS